MWHRLMVWLGIRKPVPSVTLRQFDDILKNVFLDSQFEDIYDMPSSTAERFRVRSRGANAHKRLGERS